MKLGETPPGEEYDGEDPQGYRPMTCEFEESNEIAAVGVVPKMIRID
jgi:hypothetical protein